MRNGNGNCYNLNNARLVIPETFEDCLSYGQRQFWLYQQIVDLDERVRALEERLGIDENTNND